MDVVLANAGVAIYCAKNLHSIEDGILIAKDSIESGNAYKCFKTLMDI
jgi:anthranilate phosphoribosyltransferase